MKFLVKYGVLLMPALALAMPAFGAPRQLQLSDSQQPGSVIIFPKFINAPAVRLDNATTGPVLPRTEIEIGVVCPDGVTCTDHQPVKIRFHWQCPGSQDAFFKFVCPEVDFDVVVSVNGKLAFSADGLPINLNTPRVPKAPCRNGYLIGWVVNLANPPQPIKFDGLIGDAVLRGPALVAPAGGTFTGTSTAVSAYPGITIQADPNAAPGSLVGTAGNELHFSGDPGEYLAVTGTLFGDVKFDNLETDPAHVAPSPANAFSRTFLTFMTLDTNSNAPNNPTFVPLKFYNESKRSPSTTDNDFEMLTSTFVEFLCYGQFALSDIDGNLTQFFQQTRKGTFIAGPAEKFAFGGTGDEEGLVTLLGVVHTIEGSMNNAYMERSYIYTPYNDSKFVETEFELLPSGD